MINIAYGVGTTRSTSSDKSNSALIYNHGFFVFSHITSIHYSGLHATSSGKACVHLDPSFSQIAQNQPSSEDLHST